MIDNGANSMFKDRLKKNKICHVTSVHNRYDVRIFHKECKSLAQFGYNVTLLVNDNSSDEVKDGINIVSTKYKGSNRYSRMITARRHIRKKMIDIDAELYHFHDPELLPDAKWIKKYGKIVIFDFHENVSQQILFKMWIPRSIRIVISMIYEIYEKRAIKKLDALISVTPQIVNRLKIYNKRTIMITNYPINEERYSVNNVKKNRSICFAGGIFPQWNHENIIKAIESIDDIEYILAGSGPDEYINKLRNIEGWTKVNFLGRIPHEKVKIIYSKAMIGMTLLSNNSQVGDEGTLGNTKIFEYMEAGLPVICSHNKIWRDIIDKYECGIVVNPDDTIIINNSIQKLLDNPELALHLGNNGRKAIEKEFNWSTQEELLINFYDKLIMNHKTYKKG